jgi:hypothetical protein
LYRVEINELKTISVRNEKRKNQPLTRCIANRAVSDKLKVLFFEQATPKQSFDV